MVLRKCTAYLSSERTTKEVFNLSVSQSALRPEKTCVLAILWQNKPVI